MVCWASWKVKVICQKIRSKGQKILFRTIKNVATLRDTGTNIDMLIKVYHTQVLCKSQSHRSVIKVVRLKPIYAGWHIYVAAEGEKFKLL